MRKIKILGQEIRMLSKETKGTLEKIQKIIQQYKDKVLHFDKCRNGMFRSYAVSRNERLVLDSDGKMYYCTHEKYNNFLQKR